MSATDAIKAGDRSDQRSPFALFFPPWMDQAVCAQTDPEEFFPEKGGSTSTAKAICGRCDVQADCLDYAVTHGERHGIWGGLSERDRRHLYDQIPTTDTADDTWFTDGDDFTYDTDLGETA